MLCSLASLVDAVNLTLRLGVAISARFVVDDFFSMLLTEDLDLLRDLLGEHGGVVESISAWLLSDETELLFFNECSKRFPGDCPVTSTT